jgi:hypothetical protein
MIVPAFPEVSGPDCCTKYLLSLLVIAPAMEEVIPEMSRDPAGKDGAFPYIFNTDHQTGNFPSVSLY